MITFSLRVNLQSINYGTGVFYLLYVRQYIEAAAKDLESRLSCDDHSQRETKRHPALASNLRMIK